MKAVAWKIFEDKKGEPWFMFCALNGTRRIELDNVLTAEVRPVRDGLGETEYLSGFHIVKDFDDLHKYAQRFKNVDNKVVCQVYFECATPKPTNKSLALLTKRLRVSTEQWEDRIKLREIKQGKTK